LLVVITGYPVVIIVGFFANDQKQFPLNSSGRHRELFSIAGTMLGPSSRRLEQTRSFQMFSSHHTADAAASSQLAGVRSTKRGAKRPRRRHRRRRRGYAAAAAEIRW
jgi:hypothetical protein